MYLIDTITAGLWVRKLVTGVDDFLVAGRILNLYLGIASLAATEFGIATCMANAELGFKNLTIFDAFWTDLVFTRRFSLITKMILSDRKTSHSS